MRKPLQKPGELISAILGAGIRVILLCLVIEVALMIVASVVGIVIWIGHGFFSGLLSGMVTFVLGQSMVVVVIDSFFQLPAPRKPVDPLPSDDAVLEALRAELGSETEQDAPPAPPDPPHHRISSRSKISASG